MDDGWAFLGPRVKHGQCFDIIRAAGDGCFFSAGNSFLLI